MEEQWLKDLGPYAIVVVFALYIVLKDMGFIKTKGDDRRVNVPPVVRQHIETLNGSADKIKNIELLAYDLKKKTDDLYKWHDQRDSDGAFSWYVRKSLETAIEKLANSVDKQTEVLASLAMMIRQTDLDVKEIKLKVEACPKANH